MLIVCLAALITGVEKALYKVFVHTKNHYGFSIFWLSIASFIFGLIAFFSSAFPLQAPWGWAFLNGAIWTCATGTNFKSYSLIDVSLKVLISRFKLMVVLVLAYLFLGESLTYSKLMGSALIVLGIAYASFDSRKLHGERLGILLSFVSASFYGVALTLDKKISPHFPPAYYTFLMFFIPLILLTLLHWMIWPHKKLIAISKRERLGGIVAAVLSSIAYFGMIMAYKTMDAGITVAILESGNVISLLIGVFALNEKHRAPQKIFASIVIVIGAVVLAS